MYERPKSVAAASALSMIGAVFVVIAIAISLDLNDEDIGLRMGTCLLSLILFLAIAGSLFSNGQWSWRFLIFMEVLAAAVPIASYLLEMMDFAFALAAAVLACLVIILTSASISKRWIESGRV